MAARVNVRIERAFKRADGMHGAALKSLTTEQFNTLFKENFAHVPPDILAEQMRTYKISEANIARYIAFIHGEAAQP